MLFHHVQGHLLLFFTCILSLYLTTFSCVALALFSLFENHTKIILGAATCTPWSTVTSMPETGAEQVSISTGETLATLYDLVNISERSIVEGARKCSCDLNLNFSSALLYIATSPSFIYCLFIFFMLNQIYCTPNLSECFKLITSYSS